MAHQRAGTASGGGGRAESRRRVLADDGVALHVRVRGRGPTVVFSHGFTADSTDWDAELAVLGETMRVVAWDQRGHGRSGWGAAGRATVDQTGSDLAAVVDAVAPGEPVLLVGHSMGGMSILALAHRRPEWFGTRVRGAVLVATSGGELVRDGAVGLAHRSARRLGLMPAVMGAARLAAPVADRLPWRSSAVGRRVVRHLVLGPDAPEADVRAAQRRAESVPLPVTSAFGESLLAHDQTAALGTLARVPVTVIAASADRLTPAEHGRRLADALGPRARLVTVPGAAHAVNVTHHRVVRDAVEDVAARAGREAAGEQRATRPPRAHPDGRG